MRRGVIQSVRRAKPRQVELAAPASVPTVHRKSNYLCTPLHFLSHLRCAVHVARARERRSVWRGAKENITGYVLVFRAATNKPRTNYAIRMFGLVICVWMLGIFVWPRYFIFLWFTVDLLSIPNVGLKNNNKNIISTLHSNAKLKWHTSTNNIPNKP